MLDLNNLSKEEKARIVAQIAAEQKEEENRRRLEKEKYREIVDAFVRENIEKLKVLSEAMQRVKNEIFQDAASILDLKNEMFASKLDRASDSFTTSDGRSTVKLGNRINEGWDDTVNAGIEKVKLYLDSLAKDDNSAALVDTVFGLL